MVDNKVWVGIDAGKELHWAHVLDASGQHILSAAFVKERCFATA